MIHSFAHERIAKLGALPYQMHITHAFGQTDLKTIHPLHEFVASGFSPASPLNPISRR